MDDTWTDSGLWERAGENTLTGLFLRQMRAQLDQARAGQDEQRQAQIVQAVQFGLAALERREDPFLTE